MKQFSPSSAGIIGVDERLHQGSRKEGDVEPGHKPTTGDFTERCLRKVITPEPLPSRDAGPVGADELRKLAD